MKIQLKTGLLDEHHDQLSQITSEKDILQVCHNPFILDMQYSFQTPAHAIIVTELVRGGDLGEALKSSREGYIIEDRVRLYSAEIGLALNHMHELGLIYRDLKPGNVLLGEDGHVILADMGLAAGFDPTLLRKDENNSKYIPQNPKTTRRKTTVGTRGYMAPEIISGKLVKRDQRPGYTYAVDYWSLGVTIFELMCGYQPFSVYSGGNFFQEVANEEIFRLSPRTQHKIELQKMAQGVAFPAHISKAGQDFLKRLLDVTVEQRLGCNSEKGFAEFMEHPFFESIDWEKLMMKHIDPKFKPALPLLTDKKIYNSYEHMMSHFDMRDKDFIRRKCIPHACARALTFTLLTRSLCRLSDCRRLVRGSASRAAKALRHVGLHLPVHATSRARDREGAGRNQHSVQGAAAHRRRHKRKSEVREPTILTQPAKCTLYRSWRTVECVLFSFHIFCQYNHIDNTTRFRLQHMCTSQAIPELQQHILMGIPQLKV